MRITKYTIIFTLVIFNLSLFGQEQKTMQKDTTLSGKIDEVTVTAFRSPYNIFNIPAPVNVISPLQLEMGNSFTTVEALNQVSGVLMHSGTLNTNRLTIRGIGARTPYATNKIKAYFGEIPLTSGDGETTLEDLENSAISRAEIVKGPSSSLFGAGLAGVVLFYPKSVAGDFVQNQTTIGSFGTIKNILSAGISNKTINILALGSVLKSDGYRENNETNRYNMLLNSAWKITKTTELQVLLKATKMKAYIPSSLDLPTFEATSEKAAANWMNAKGNEEYTNGQFGVTLNFALPDFQKISAAAFGSFKKADELRPFNRLGERSDYLGWRAYYQKQFEGENNRFTLSSGIEFFRENYEWSTFSNANENVLSDNREKRQYENLFVQLESGFSERYFISAGVNGNLTRFFYTDFYTENGDQSGEQHYKPAISPRLGVNIVVNRNISVFGNISHGFSTPTFEETLLPAGEINPDIKPETGLSTEIGFRSEWSDRLQFSASYYRIYIKNLLVARRTGEDAYVGVNAGKSEHPGFETELRWIVTNPERFPSLILSGTATFANYHFTEFTDLDIDYSGRLIPGTTKNTWFALANFNVSKKFGFNFWHRFTGKMPVNDANSEFSDPFGISNFEGRFNTKINRLKLQLHAGIQNIFDVHYASMLAVNAPSVGGNLPRYYYPGNPRNYFVSVLIGLE
ncbi:MAG: TonB-dependent receptor [Draconibacterium sp.]